MRFSNTACCRCTQWADSHSSPNHIVLSPYEEASSCPDLGSTGPRCPQALEGTLSSYSKSSKQEQAEPLPAAFTQLGTFPRRAPSHLSEHTFSYVSKVWEKQQTLLGLDSPGRLGFKRCVFSTRYEVHSVTPDQNTNWRKASSFTKKYFAWRWIPECSQRVKYLFPGLRPEK